jgi:hypothetical protein
MKVTALLATVFLVLQDPIGCDQKKPPKEAAQPKEPPIRRFEPVTSHGTSDVALDTKTGQLCRTWDWVYKNRPDAADLNDLPTCYSIYLAEQKTIVVTPEDMKNP